MNNAENIVILDRAGASIHQIGNANKYTLQSLKNYELRTNSKVIKVDSLQNSFEIKGKKWLIIDSLEVYPNQKFDFVIICQNPKINLKRLNKL